MNAEPPVIEISHLVRKFGRTDAVNDLSLRVNAGRCYGFFGRNGAGKTTTICLVQHLAFVCYRNRRPTRMQLSLQVLALCLSVILSVAVFGFLGGFRPL